jgi:hypothetical protein
MSTKVGIIAEGPIDHVLLPALLAAIATHKAAYKWPVDAGDVAELMPIRKTGHGGVLEKVRRLVTILKHNPLDYRFFVILLDEKTDAVQREIRELIRGDSRFVLGVAIKELEAWWLGDRTDTLAWCGFDPRSLPPCRYGKCDQNHRLIYAAEKDDKPKRTLNELTELSTRFDRLYGDGNVELALQFVDQFWKVAFLNGNRLDEIAAQCPHGFGQFQQSVKQAFHDARDLLFR